MKCDEVQNLLPAEILGDLDGDPSLRRDIQQYEQMARRLAENEAFLRVALTEVCPYGSRQARRVSPCLQGRPGDAKKRFIATQATALLRGLTSSLPGGAKPPVSGIFTRKFKKLCREFLEIQDFWHQPVPGSGAIMKGERR